MITSERVNRNAGLNLAGVALPDINLREAIRIYYEKIEISSKDIQAMFNNKVGGTRMRKMRSEAHRVARETGELIWDIKKLNTRAAFKAWGLEIAELEARYARLKKLGFLENAG